MNGEDILKLVNAGFTKEEIGKMFSTGEPKPKEEETPKEQPVEKEQTKEQETGMTTLEQKFDKLMDILTNSNIIGANQPPENTVDDIIAQIIDPTYKKGDK